MARKGRTSLAQSGGKNSTFGGGKGGTKFSRGVTVGRRIGFTTIRGLRAAIRTEGGNNNPARQTGRVGHPPPLRTGGKKLVKATVRRPVRAADR